MGKLKSRIVELCNDALNIPAHFLGKLGRSTQLISNQSLSGDAFLNELLQNADDAKFETPRVRHINIEIINGWLIFSHNGLPFEVDHLEAICDTANRKRKKLHDNNSIGNKGIGFKALFSISERVIVFSEEDIFSFDKHYEPWRAVDDFPWETTPIYIEQKQLPPHLLQFANGQQVTFAIQLTSVSHTMALQTVRNLIQEPKGMLFLREVRSLTFRDENRSEHLQWTPELIENTPTFSISRQHVQSTGATQYEKTWLKFSQQIPIPAEIQQQLRTTANVAEKYMTAEAISLELAFEYNNNGVIPAKGVNLFCFLPTTLQIPGGFLVNTELFLELARKNLDDKPLSIQWNTFLIQQVIHNQFTFLHYIAQRTGFWPYIFDLMIDEFPSSLASLASSKKNIMAPMKPGLDNTAIVKSIHLNGSLTIASSIIDELRFLERFGTDQLKAAIAHPQIPVAKLRKYDAKIFGLTEIGAYIKSDFFQQQLKNRTADGPRLAAELIKYAAQLYDIWPESDRPALITFFRDLPFILSSQHTVKKPSEILLPDDTLKYLAVNCITIVHATIYALVRDKESNEAKFLKEIKVNELSIPQAVSEVNKHPDNIENFTKRVFEKYRTNLTSLDKQDWENLKNLKVKTKKGTFSPPAKAFLSNAYHPKEPLAEYINSDVVVADSYLQGENAVGINLWRAFFANLGVNQEINGENLAQLVESLHKHPEALIRVTGIIHHKCMHGIDNYVDKLKKLPLVTVDNVVKENEEFYFSDAYQPVMPVQTMVNTLNYVSAAYMQPDGTDRKAWLLFFSKLGVKDRISLRFKEGYHYRKHFSDNVAYGSEYLAWLETHYGRDSLMPSGTAGYQGQHWISGYFEIDYLLQIVNSVIFWQIIRDNWATIQQHKEVTYHTRFSDKEVKANVYYYVHAFCIRYYRKQPSELYIPSLTSNIGASLPSVQMAAVLSDEQLRGLGFREYLSGEDTVTVLNGIAGEMSTVETPKQISAIYQNLAANSEILPTTTPMEDEVLLLSQAGEFLPSSQLFVLATDEVRSREKIPQMLWRPDASIIDAENMERVGRYLGANVIKKEELSVNPTIDMSRDNCELIAQRLILVGVLQAENQLIDSATFSKYMTSFIRDLFKKLKKMSFHITSSLHVSYKDVFSTAVNAWVDESSPNIQLFYQDYDVFSFRPILRFLIRYFSIQIDFDNVEKIFFQDIPLLLTDFSGPLFTEENLKLAMILCDSIESEVANEKEPISADEMESTVLAPTTSTQSVASEESSDENEDMDVDKPATNQVVPTSSQPSASSSAASSSARVFSGFLSSNGGQRSSKLRKIETPTTPNAAHAEQGQDSGNQATSSDSEDDFDYADRAREVKTMTQTTLVQLWDLKKGSKPSGLFKQSKAPNEKTRKQVGDIGEQYVYNHLKSQQFPGWRITENDDGFEATNGETLCRVIWYNKNNIDKNKEERSTLPYDITIEHFRAAEPTQVTRTEYIEVKATRGKEWKDPALSKNEMEILIRYGENYSIYYVLDVKGNIQHILISDPLKAIKDGEMKIDGEIRLQVGNRKTQSF